MGKSTIYINGSCSIAKCKCLPEGNMRNKQIWRLPEMGYPNSWIVYDFMMDNPVKMDDLGLPPISGPSHMGILRSL